MIRNALKLGSDKKEGVPFAGLIHPDNPPSGPYGGTSLVWFPGEHGALLDLGVGTRGLSPDEGLLLRPGHRRRVQSLRRYLDRLGVTAWSKADPAALGVKIPKSTCKRFPDFTRAFKRYSTEMYCIAEVPRDNPELAYKVVQAFFDLYAFERGWEVYAEFNSEVQDFLGTLRADLFVSPTANELAELIKERRFVVLYGPPGTGKTRIAEEVRRDFFADHGRTVQFHPAVTYEDFMVGLAPTPATDGLTFKVRPGWLVEANEAAKKEETLLVVDEINRGDLAKVLGEAVYLFEPNEVGGERARVVHLPHEIDGSRELRLSEGLHVLGTMNTADRSLAGLDLAIRRRFAFVPMPPSRTVLEEQGLELALQIFDQVQDVFVEHASDEALALLPGHSYFLARSEEELKRRLRFELLPLLDEYLREGLLGPAAAELRAVRDQVEAAIG